jgi:hypothetical protein
MLMLDMVDFLQGGLIGIAFIAVIAIVTTLLEARRTKSGGGSADGGNDLD